MIILSRIATYYRPGLMDQTSKETEQVELTLDELYEKAKREQLTEEELYRVRFPFPRRYEDLYDQVQGATEEDFRLFQSPREFGRRFTPRTYPVRKTERETQEDLEEGRRYLSILTGEWTAAGNVGFDFDHPDERVVLWPGATHIARVIASLPNGEGLERWKDWWRFERNPHFVTLGPVNGGDLERAGVREWPDPVRRAIILQWRLVHRYLLAVWRRRRWLLPNLYHNDVSSEGEDLGETTEEETDDEVQQCPLTRRRPASPYGPTMAQPIRRRRRLDREREEQLVPADPQALGAAAAAEATEDGTTIEAATAPSQTSDHNSHPPS